MLSLLTLLATAAVAVAAPIDIQNLASIKSINQAVESISQSINSAETLAAGRTFHRVTAQAPWSVRAGGNLEWDSVHEMFILHGVGFHNRGGVDSEALEEVWTAGSNGRFTLVKTRSPFDPLYSAQSTQDVNGVQYRIQGTTDSGDERNDVWRSSDSGKTWVAQHAQRTAKKLLDSTRYLGAAVALVNNPSTLLVWGGESGPGALHADVWRSGDSGINWDLVAETDDSRRPSFGARTVNVGLASSVKIDKEDVDVVYQLMGYSGYDSQTNRGIYNNDIWISTGGPRDIGRTWTLLQAHAPWAARGDAQAEMTSNGVMVVSSGLASYVSGEDEAVLNDVWASLDGGYSWGMCYEDALFDDRSFTYSAIDGEGHLWVMGGQTRDGPVNDIWKSDHSYTDVATVALQCNLLVPSCGAGLKCLPSSSGFKAGLWGVICDACPGGPLVPSDSGEIVTPKSSSSSMWTVAVVILVIVAAGALAAAYHFYRKATNAVVGVSTEQAWWGKNGSENLVGGDAQAPSDAMYNPLNIRDSNATM